MLSIRLKKSKHKKLLVDLLLALTYSLLPLLVWLWGRKSEDEVTPTCIYPTSVYWGDAWTATGFDGVNWKFAGLRQRD